MRALRARSARVTGAPGTSSSGTVIATAMCITMCMLNSTRPQMPGALQVAHTNSAQPSTQQTVRRTGHASPRRRSRTTPAR